MTFDIYPGLKIHDLVMFFSSPSAPLDFHSQIGAYALVSPAAFRVTHRRRAAESVNAVVESRTATASA
jgi:hypothetical protein